MTLCSASVAGIVQLLSKDFVKLVLIALVIASPIAWWAMNNWLEDFAYRIDIQWWVFAISGFAAVIIAYLPGIGRVCRSGQISRFYPGIPYQGHVQGIAADVRGLQ